MSAAVAVSVGCAAGIGPEVSLLAAAKLRDVPVVLVGDELVLLEHAAHSRIARRRFSLVRDRASIAALAPGEIGLWAESAPVGERVRPGKPTPAAGAAQLRWIDQALELVTSGACRALVTGPVSKEAIATSGAPGAARFRGHTEHLAERLGASEVIMAFALGRFATSLVTTHLPLRKVARAVTPAKVASASYWLARLLYDLGHARPRIVVAGVNPHAGEGGLLGDEEARAVLPGIVAARRRLRSLRAGARVSGPLGAESAFRLAAAGEYEGVVAMYHDQATIACKLMGFGEAVNVTLGLPIVRTSVDHGTAYDLAGKGKASAKGMLAAIEMAVGLSS